MRVAEPDPRISRLPEALRATARVFHNGEVAWPNEHAAAAIDALADNQNLILGLDARTMHSDGGVMEIPVSAWEEKLGETPEEAIERARQEALDALRFAKSEGTHVLVTWRPAGLLV
jgi:hypothetical protein